MKTDQKTPREGNIMVAVSGTRYVADEDDVLQAINLVFVIQHVEKTIRLWI